MKTDIRTFQIVGDTKVVFLLIMFLILLISSCSIFYAPSVLITPKQPGVLALEAIQQSEERLNSLLESPNFDFNPANSAVKMFPHIVISLLRNIETEHDIGNAIAKLSSENQLSSYLTVSMALFPIQTYRIAADLADQKPAFISAIKDHLRKHKHLPSMIFPRNEKLAETHRIVPLFHSASITLYNQNAESRITVMYKKTNESTWKNDTMLYWEPVQGAFSGSILNLDPNTNYDIEVSVSALYLWQQSETTKYQFKTRRNKPEVDPEKVYYLKDIYTGGQLDLKALNIEGAPAAWAKVVGDDSITVSAKNGSAISIGSQSYILFENIKVQGGLPHAITSNEAHHLWFDGCDISKWGRITTYIKGGLSYESESVKHPINNDAGFFLKNSGVIVVENCNVHSPNSSANSWEFGHPRGPTAFFASANHPDERYTGQIVIRNNRFYGKNKHRFNDVIEGQFNGRVWGGFVRDSVIHNNYLAYANDDIIEIDGGQNNVLVYNNQIEQGFVGISAIPNMKGPSYLIDNDISNMGDERGKSWTDIKLGGSFSRPTGTVLIDLNNSDLLIKNAGFMKDDTASYQKINACFD